MKTPQDNPTERAPDAGFSLVELLVVLVILGILATVVVFAVRGHRRRRRIGGVRIGTAGGRVARSSRGSRRTRASPCQPTGVGPDRFEQTLVEAGMIRSTSTFLDLSDDGSLIPAAGSPC